MLRALVLGLCLLLQSCRAAPPRSASGAGTRWRVAGDGSKSGRRLHGRFLHITDVHPDPFYKTYSSTEEDAACHRKRGPAGFYGAETSACDSPVSLVDETFKWIDHHLKDDIDFVVWTGDSARHDNDEKIPRTEKQVIAQNELLVRKFRDVFGTGADKEDPTKEFVVPIVPTFGNNDIMPHNIFTAGPNRWTLKYLDIWRVFIPEAQRHQFQQGGWFYVEVIPGKLAVISLNTIYFFDSNSAVDGCANKHEPGYEHMEWLRIQLQTMRDRSMKAILTGHVPPARTNSKESWDETCWQKYTLWLRQYRDIIVGSLYGHMNIDHFMLQDFEELSKGAKKGRMASSVGVQELGMRESIFEEGEITVASASDYLLDLRSTWAKLPSPPSTSKKATAITEYIAEEEEPSIWCWLSSMMPLKKNHKVAKGAKKRYFGEIGGKYAERFSMAHVSPSVVPNYFPTLRVFEYNIDGLEDLVISNTSTPSTLGGVSQQVPEYAWDSDYEDDSEALLVKKKKKKEKDARKKPKKYKFKVPKGPSKSAPPGPAYSPQPFTLLGYTQYFANLTHINNDFVATPPNISQNQLAARSIFGLQVSEDGDIEAAKWKEGKHGKHQGKRPRPEPHPKKFKYEVEYSTMEDAIFKLKDLTVRSYVDLARRIGAGQEEDAVSVLENKEEEMSGCIDIEDKKKNGGKKRGKKSAWFTFVKRAFVGTMDPQDIEDVFGLATPQTQAAHAEEEVLEL